MTLLNDLGALRTNTVGRPIIFVVHSLGGIVIQDALLVCNNPNDQAQSDILLSTRGIAFLGTPHAGADLERFATAVARIVSTVKKPNKKLLQVLNRNSEVLANITGGFHTMVLRRLRDSQSGVKPIELHAFIEEKPVKILEVVSRTKITIGEMELTPGSVLWSPNRPKFQATTSTRFLQIIWE